MDQYLVNTVNPVYDFRPSAIFGTRAVSGYHRSDEQYGLDDIVVVFVVQPRSGGRSVAHGVSHGISRNYEQPSLGGAKHHRHCLKCIAAPRLDGQS
jgi:hypothetical protein